MKAKAAFVIGVFLAVTVFGAYYIGKKAADKWWEARAHIVILGAGPNGGGLDAACTGGR